MDNMNAMTQQVYSPSNQEHLDNHKKMLGLSSDQWAGFKQWQELGRQVSKGAKGCKIFMVVDKKEKNDQGEEKKRKVLKARYVFNWDHTEEAKQQ